MRRASVITGAALLLAAVQISAQEKPSFAGSWTLVADAAAPAAGGGRAGGMGGMAGLGQTATIEQSATALTITRTTQLGELKSVYNLDGSASSNTLNFNGTAIPQVSKAVWNGGKLAITTTIDFNGQSIETSMTLSLDGTNLLVESTGMGRGGAAAANTTMKYTKGGR